MTFATERERKVTSSLDEAIARLEEFRVHRSTYGLQTLSVDSDFRIHSNGDVFQPTEWAFKHFLNSLGIPYKFGMKIPKDLLDIIVARLRTIEAREVQFLVRDGVLVNVVSADYVAPGLAQILHLFDGRPVDSVWLSDRGMRLATETAVEVEPEEGDRINVGILVRASETGGPYPYGVLRTYRLSCTNDAVVHPDFGVAKWDRRVRDDGFDAFRLSIQGLLAGAEAVIPALNALPRKTLDVKEFKHLWLQSSRLVGGSGADMLFKVNEATRKQFSNAAKARLEVDTGLNSYQVFNDLSLCARDMRYVAGEQMMAIAGQLIKPGG